MLKADRVFKNGQVVTCDGVFSIASSFAVRGGRILAVSKESLESLATSRDQVTDLKGRCVLPGQVDGYSHIMTSGLDLLPSGGKINITKLQSIETILGAIATRVAGTPKGEWIATSCMYRGELAEGRWPDRHDLDKVAPDHPAYIMQGGRPILANSRALALASIDDNTPDPTDPAGKIVRDAHGKPTGQLIGGAADLARRRWSKALNIPPEEWDFMYCGEQELIAALEAQQSVFHACGVTATRDVATMRREVGAFVRARRENRLKLRTQVMIIIPERYMRAEQDFAEVFQSYFQAWSLGDSLLSIGGVAIDYSLDGWRMLDVSLLARLIADSNRKGWTMAVTPGIGGEQEVDEVLDALEAADRERPIFDRHFPIMHPMGFRRPDQLARARKLGLTLNPNPLLNHFAAERSVKMFAAVAKSGLLQSSAKSGTEQAAAMWGLSAATWINAGLLVSAGSNTPAASYDCEHPLLGLYTFQTGDTRVGRLIDGQSVSRRQAIEAYTRNGAAAMGFAREFGSLEPGKLADFVVFDTDVLHCVDSALTDVKVLATYFGGEPVYQR
ncbi:MAG: amidohydrolase [Steroidobacteraceae bacterium]